MRLDKIKIPLIFFGAKLAFHLFTNTNWGFHRDELLYLAIGHHPDWGYWSNPPLTGWLSWLGQNTLGDGQGAIRLIPALFSAGTVFLCCLMAKEMGGKNRAQILAGIASISSLAYLRSGHMFQPVSTDIFFWALGTYILVRFLRSENHKYILWLGVAIGFGFLNKYTVLFLMAAIGIGLALTPARRIFLKKEFYTSALIALLIVLPNLYWQWDNNFPVIIHLSILAEEQLSAVSPFNFLFDQLLMHLWSALVWLPGLYFLLFKKEMKKFRPLGWFAISTLVLFLAMSGKAYYTLGMFPVLMAAGGVFWEKAIEKKWIIYALAGFIFLGNIWMLPASVPIFSVEKSIAYFEKLGVESLTRWERGNVENLPQDYADMLGWEELGTLADKAIAESGDANSCMIYCEEYCHAGAVQRYGKHPEKVVSFSDSYRLWMPHHIDKKINTLIYINDEMGEDVKALFENIKIIGAMETPHARERGTTVYLCQNPRSSLPDFWNERVEEVREYYDLK